MIVLASASPRRESLLREAGLHFVVVPSHVPEHLAADVGPVEAAMLLAERKARAVAAMRGREDWVIGADTIVSLAPADGGGAERILGKPADAAQAAHMLSSLSGTRHRVVTGVSLLRGEGLGGETSPGARTVSETTWVTMRAIEPAEVAAYVASGEWEGKAGGYAIQETADRFVVGLEGRFDNVVGLPVASTLGLLREAGAS